MLFNLPIYKGTAIDEITKLPGTWTNSPTYLKDQKGLCLSKHSSGQTGGIYTGLSNFSVGSVVFAFKSSQENIYNHNICMFSNDDGKLFGAYLEDGGSIGQLQCMYNGFAYLSAQQYNDGRWHLGIWTSDIELYIDNTLVSVGSEVAAPTGTANQAWIGDSSLYNGMDGEIGFKTQLHDTVLTSCERYRIYEEFRRLTIFHEQTSSSGLIYKNELIWQGANNQKRFIDGFIEGTGTYRVNELTADDSVLKELKKGFKFLECANAGTIAIQKKSAYNTVSVYLNKGDTANNIFVGFVSKYITDWASNYGYQFAYSVSENLYLIMMDGSQNNRWGTITQTNPINTWYKIDIYRLREAGYFKAIQDLNRSTLINSPFKPYDTFISNGSTGFTAISGASAESRCGTDQELPIVTGQDIVVEFYMLSTEDRPFIALRNSIAGGVISNIELCSVGFNSITLTPTTTTTGAFIFTKGFGQESNVIVSNLRVRGWFVADTIAILESGGAFGSKPIIISTGAGGFGNNPHTDTTYNDSDAEFLVIDADVGDKIAVIYEK